MKASVEMPFADRSSAGRLLALAVQDSAEEIDLVLALPRGGVAIAAEVARLLGKPFDVFLVRKVGAPGQPELALGAVAETGHLELNQRVIESLQVSQSELSDVVARERVEMDRRLAHYRSGRAPPEVLGRRVLVVDDGIATGATMLVALRALRTQQPDRLLLGTPLCPTSTLNRLRPLVDRAIVLASPDPFGAVGAWYADFRQMTDDEVMDLLSTGRREG